MFNYKVLFLLTALILPACSSNKAQQNIQSIKIGKMVKLEKIIAPSGSTVLYSKQEQPSIYVVSDNQNALFEVDNHINVINTIPLLTNDSIEDSKKLPNKLKSDFEALTSIKDSKGHLCLLALSSHSGKLIERRMIVLYNPKTKEVKRFETQDLLFRLRKQIDHHKINLEGIFSDSTQSKYLYLMNRGNHSMNCIFQVSIPEFLSYLGDPSHHRLTIRKHLVHIPTTRGIKPGLSGSFVLNDHLVVLTASLENSCDITDGDDVGSLIAIWDYKKSKMVTPFTVIKDKSDKPLNVKAESIIITSYNQSGHKSHLKGFLLCDNDDQGAVYIPLEFDIK